MRPPLGSRVLRAASLGAINIVSWVVLPEYLGSRLAETSGSIQLTGPLIFTAGLVIAALQVLGALASSGGLSAIFTGGSYVVSAFYIYLATDAGSLKMAVGGTTVELSFVTLLALVMAASLFNASRVWIAYLLDGSEGGTPSRDEVRG